MKKESRKEITADITEFRLPRYHELPDLGLYLKQVVRLINDTLEPCFCITVTETMLSNYVKKHIVSSPIKKQYNRNQIAALIFITLAKTVVSLENLSLLLKIQQKFYDEETAYNYFCDELENVLLYVFGHKEQMDAIGAEESEAKSLLRKVVITIAHKLYLENTFLEIIQDAGN